MPAWIGCFGGAPIAAVAICGSLGVGADEASTSNAYRRLEAQRLGARGERIDAKKLWHPPTHVTSTSSSRWTTHTPEPKPEEPKATVQYDKDGSVVIDWGHPGGAEGDVAKPPQQSKPPRKPKPIVEPFIPAPIVPRKPTAAEIVEDLLLGIYADTPQQIAAEQEQHDDEALVLLLTA